MRLSPWLAASVFAFASGASVGRSTAADGGAPAARQQAKEDERKHKPVPVYTEADLEKARQSPTAAVTILKASPAPTKADEALPAKSSETAREQTWRKKADDARAALRRAEEQVKQLETKMGGLRSDRDPVNLLDPNRLQTLEVERRRTESELFAAREAVVSARKAIEDLEDEARRQRVPPGWLRER